MNRILWIIGLMLISPIPPRSIQHQLPAIVKPDFTDMNNPASMYCVEEGFQLVFREDAQGNQYGVCKSGTHECDEWDFYNGLCFLKPKCSGTIR